MEPNGHPIDLYAVPLVAGAVTGFLAGDYLGIGTVLGILMGCFLVDVLMGLRGTRRFLMEAQYVVDRARVRWGKEVHRDSSTDRAEGRDNY